MQVCNFVGLGGGGENYTKNTLGEVKKKTCLASGLCGKKEGGGAFFFSFQNGRRTHFPKQPAGLFFSRWLPVFCFNGPHLDSGYDISLFRAGFGKRSYFSLFF